MIVSDPNSSVLSEAARAPGPPTGGAARAKDRSESAGRPGAQAMPRLLLVTTGQHDHGNKV